MQLLSGTYALCYIVLILLFSTAYNTSLTYCFVIWCLHTNKRRPCFSTLSGHPSSSCCRGMERTHEAPSNEAPHMILGYHQGRLVMYLQNNFSVEFLVDGSRLSPEPAYRFCNFNSFLFLISSGITQDCGSTSLALAMVVSTTSWRSCGI